MCVVCNRCHYDWNVIIFKSGIYSHDFIDKINTNVSIFDHKFYICNASAKKEKVACQAVANGLQLESVQEELDCLNTIEVILISKRLLLRKLWQCPKDRYQKFVGL